MVLGARHVLKSGSLLPGESQGHRLPVPLALGHSSQVTQAASEMGMLFMPGQPAI